MGPFLTKKNGTWTSFLPEAVTFEEGHVVAAGRLLSEPTQGVREACLFTKTAEAVNCRSKRWNCTNRTLVPAREPAAAVFLARKPLLTTPSIEKTFEPQDCLDEANHLPRIFCANEPNPPCIQYRYSKELTLSPLRSSGSNSYLVWKMRFGVNAYNNHDLLSQEVVIHMIVPHNTALLPFPKIEMRQLQSRNPKGGIN